MENIRQDLLKQLNELLIIICREKSLPLNNEFILQGTLPLNEIEKIERKMFENKISFVDVINSF